MCVARHTELCARNFSQEVWGFKILQPGRLELSRSLARGDLIQVYRYIHNLYNVNSDQLLHLSDVTHTRGHSLKLKKSRSNINTHANFFTPRIVNLWNGLKEETVQATSVDAFKNRLDIEWDDKAFKFDFEATVEY